MSIFAVDVEIEVVRVGRPREHMWQGKGHTQSLRGIRVEQIVKKGEPLRHPR